MRRTAFTLAALLAIAVLLGVARSANAAGGTYTLQCGSSAPVTVVKPNDSAAIYTNGSTIYITAIGAIKSDGSAQSQSVPCTINGFGPIPFLIING